MRSHQRQRASACVFLNFNSGGKYVNGIDVFLQRFARNPEILREPMSNVCRRLKRLRDDEYLCREGEPAECFWIVDDGTIVVGTEGKIVRRIKGDLVGEIAFHRRDEAKRTTSMRADGVARVWQIDRVFLDELTPEQSAAWFETVAAVLAEKVIEATEQRTRLLSDNVSLDHVLRRFVCDDGLMAVNATFGDPELANIVPDQTTAMLWFSDVAGFSSFAKEMAPKDAARQMRRFMDIQVEEITRAGGEIDKFMGDGLMAFWRVPDDARIRDRVPKAVLAAFNSIDRIRAIINEESLSLDIRIGLHLGPVVIGDFGGSGRIAYTLMGETVNSASRYEQARLDFENNQLGALRLSEMVFAHIEDTRLLARLNPEPRRFLAKAGREFTTYTSID